MTPFHILRIGLKPCLARPARSSFASNIVRQTHFGTRVQHRLPLLLIATSVGLGVSSLTSPSTRHCDVIPPSTNPILPPPPKSSVNTYELTFGTICGLCAGVFIKKSARMVAFFLGGLFVVLQYLGSASLVKVDWARMASRFENLLYTTDVVGNRKPPTARSIWKWTVDFLTADFQPRASFVAGLTLGLRVG